jgi:hypothetical protein
MSCKACGAKTHDWFGDPWCDECGGVPAKNGLLFRHVANVRGPKYGFPVVWDESAQHYLFRWPNKVNPRSGGGGIDEDFRPTPVLSTFGSLDMVLTQAMGVIRSDQGDAVPELSAGMKATEVEKQLLGV